MSNSYRLVTMIAHWSYDHWLDLNDGSPEAAKMDQGPDEFQHALSATFNHPPSPSEINDVISALKESSTGMNSDGKTEIKEFSIMDNDAWQEFINNDPVWLARFTEKLERDPTPIIYEHNNATEAALVSDRSRAKFVKLQC